MEVNHSPAAERCFTAAGRGPGDESCLFVCLFVAVGGASPIRLNVLSREREREREDTSGLNVNHVYFKLNTTSYKTT